MEPTVLNAAQRRAAEHPPDAGALWVVAGAGCGKTQMLATRLAWLVEQGADPNRLLLMSFSRRAATELAARAGRMLHRSLGLPASTRPPALPWAGTFHSVASRLLREDAAHVGLHPGFTVLDRADAQDLLAQTRLDLGLAEQHRRFPLAATCLALHSRVQASGRPLAEVLAQEAPWCQAHEAALATLFSRYGEAKLQQQLLDFDDLLLAWRLWLQHPAGASRVRARFDHVLVDEMQDLNGVQSDILHALCPGGRGLTLVGDDAQAIYGFRGADVRHMLRFGQSLGGPVTALTLEQNYRSTPSLLAASNAVMALATEGHRKQLWSARADGGRPVLQVVADEQAQARGVADAVLLAREQGLLLRRQAVLFRTGTHSATLELELLRRGIPFVKYGGLRFNESAHVRDVMAVLRWADNPAALWAAQRVWRLVPGLGPASWRRLGATPMAWRGFEPPPGARAAWAALLALWDVLQAGGPAWPSDLDEVLHWYRPHLQRLHADAPARWADLEQLRALAPSHASREHFVTDWALDPPQASGAEAGPPSRDEDWLALSTIHAAKGQEWQAVHVLNVVDGCMPADLATGDAAQVEEERRLLYVAMTRARDALTLWVPQRFHLTQQRSGGPAHVFALRSRFIPASVLPLFETRTTHSLHAGGALRQGETHAPYFDIAAGLRRAHGSGQADG